MGTGELHQNEIGSKESGTTGFYNGNIDMPRCDISCDVQQQLSVRTSKITDRVTRGKTLAKREICVSDVFNSIADGQTVQGFIRGPPSTLVVYSHFLHRRLYTQMFVLKRKQKPFRSFPYQKQYTKLI